MGDTPQHAPYEEMKDTPWITQARDIADRGGRGILDNYNKVNVFDDATNKSIEARNNQIYKRAFDNMERAYTDTMNKYNAKNYNQFGTLNATAPSYVTDQYRIDAQRQMDDLAYNQAMNYDTLRDKELARRYNTLDMFNSLYGYGQTPYQQDLMNWNTRNTNKDIDYNNQLAGASGGGWQRALSGAVRGAGTGFLSTGNPFGALAGGLAGGIGGFM
jgi:hypothetical protein